MLKRHWIGWIAVVCLLSLMPGRSLGQNAWTSSFPVEEGELVDSGRNPFFNLEPGFQATFEGGGETLIITVLDETREIDGITTRVVEERESKNGQLVEVSRNYFAISSRSNSVFYFGEEVDIYEDDHVIGHEGAWLSGQDKAKFGLMMSGQVLVGARYYQEMAPGVAMDRAQIVDLEQKVETPAGVFEHCLKIEETTPLEPGAKEYKLYAPGVGLIQDGSLKLVSFGPMQKE